MAEGFEGLQAILSRLNQLATDIRHVEGPLKAAGVYALGSIERNFQEQGRPAKWKPLADSTRAGRRKGKGSRAPRILIDSARLKNSIAMKLIAGGSGPEVLIGTNVGYAARQHFGYPGGSGRGDAKTPARPFLMLQEPEDYDAIGRIFARHIERR